MHYKRQLNIADIPLISHNVFDKDFYTKALKITHLYDFVDFKLVNF
jgi:valyl-tRNA synthetase